MYGLVLVVFLFLTVATAQWSLTSFANIDAVENLCGEFVKIRSIKENNVERGALEAALKTTVIVAVIPVHLCSNFGINREDSMEPEQCNNE